MSKRFEVFLTDGAKADLRDIHDAVSTRKNVRDASLLLETILDKVETLRQFPRRGSVPHELRDLGEQEFRQIALQHYRIVYRVSTNDVYIVIIADARQDMRSLFQRRLLRGR